MALLEVRDLHVWFDLPEGGKLHAVRGVSFDLDAGERVGLVGESGCGKTTTILAMLGLLPPSATVAGEVLLDGHTVLAVDEDTTRTHRWTDIAMVFQGAMNALNPVKTVESQIVEPMTLHGTAYGAEAKARAGELLELVGHPGGVGGPVPARVLRRDAAAGRDRDGAGVRAKVLLADEPTTALDVMVQAQILELMQRLTRDLGLALVLVTHDLPVVAQVCDRAAVMYAGEIVEAGHRSTTCSTSRSIRTRGCCSPPRLISTGRTRCSRSRARRRAWIGTSPGARSGNGATARSNGALAERPLLKPVGEDRVAACHLNDEPVAAGDRGDR